MNYETMRGELTKLCAVDVSRGDAVDALSRLRKLEKEKVTAEQLTRGAATGAIVGPLAALASKTVGGDTGKAFRKALSTAGSGRAGKAKAVGKAALMGVRGLGAAASSGAVFGSALPTVRGHLDREAEKDTLRDYVGESRSGKMRRKAKKYLGV